MPVTTRRHLASLVAAVSLASPRLARAQDAFPARPIRLVVPWPPGGGVDVLARILQQPLGAQLGQPVIIDNIGGGSGRIGNQAAARAAPDGYTLLLVNDTFAATEALPVAGTASQRDAFTPVALAITASQGIFTHPRSGLRTIQDLAAAARARPGSLNVGVPGIGSSQHLTSELLLRAAGDLRVEHVPYRGGGPLLLDLMAGSIDAGVVTFGAAAGQAASGQLIPLVVSGGERPAAFPNVPTAAESIAPGFVQTTWMGLLAPVGTPDAPIARVHAALRATLADPEVVVRMGQVGYDPSGLNGRGFGQLFNDTIAQFASIAAERGITSQS
ncbi:Bug family tripartite tricarboxylate transporter substrate binding protein [Humitalea sp. 24SJ18S-53]|uniref:Bug family tripartite tricarboxylate transporter substrate binding protein n=1 Tax=Humitalea sp. 24SJ18S-53 TaxID=3422307 RepID=UPI003D66ACEC